MLVDFILLMFLLFILCVWSFWVCWLILLLEIKRGFPQTGSVPPHFYGCSKPGHGRSLAWVLFLYYMRHIFLSLTEWNYYWYSVCGSWQSQLMLFRNVDWVARYFPFPNSIQFNSKFNLESLHNIHTTQ